MPKFNITINARKQEISAAPDMPLLWALRDLLHLTGTKFGCGAGICGACTIHEGQEAVRSCQITVAQAAGKSYTTIEGLSAAGDHPCQRAWLEEDVAQCGYCQPGQMMSATALLAQNKNPSDADIDAFMSGNICRCGTYPRIRAAIKQAAKA